MLAGKHEAHAGTVQAREVGSDVIIMWAATALCSNNSNAITSQYSRSLGQCANIRTRERRFRDAWTLNWTYAEFAMSTDEANAMWASCDSQVWLYSSRVGPNLTCIVDSFFSPKACCPKYSSCEIRAVGRFMDEPGQRHLGRYKFVMSSQIRVLRI